MGELTSINYENESTKAIIMKKADFPPRLILRQGDSDQNILFIFFSIDF